MAAGWLYMCFDGQTIIDACLTSNLQANGHGIEGVNCRDCDPCCEDLDRAFNRGPGGGGIGNAPWYDPDVPESWEFAGLLVTDIQGLNPGAFTRDVSENAGFGANLGTSKQLAPVITVTGLLLGSCCGAEYGLRWLQNALKGSCRQGRNCQGGDLEFLICEPKFSDEDCGEVDYEAELIPYIRKFRNVGLVSGPTPSYIQHGCPSCHECPMTEVTFTMSAADPCVYREPVLVADQFLFGPFEEPCPTWVTAEDRANGENCDDDAPCVSYDNCATDPDCVDVAPPTINKFESSCLSCITLERERVCFTVDTADIPVNGEATLEIEIFAGDAPLRGVQVIGWHNPLFWLPDELSPCEACFGVNVTYVAAGTTLVVDGAARTANIECPGGTTVRANPFISDTSGSPAFTFPVLEGCAEGVYTVCVYANGPVSAGATVTANLIVREC